jgi:FecR protein
MKNISRMLGALIALHIVSVAMGQAHTGEIPVVPSAGAVVLDISGKVEVHDPNGGKISLQRNSLLSEGTLVETNAGAKILFRLNDGSEILIGPHSRMLLKRDSLPGGTTLVEFLLGKLKAVVTKRYTGSPSFLLGTPSAIVAVRGTRFYVEVNSHDVTEVDVEQGLVQVTGRIYPHRSVLLEPGFSTRVGVDMNPEPSSPTDRMRPDMREQRDEIGLQQEVQAERDDQQGPSEASPQAGQEAEQTDTSPQ